MYFVLFAQQTKFVNHEKNNKVLVTASVNKQKLPFYVNTTKTKQTSNSPHEKVAFVYLHLRQLKLFFFMVNKICLLRKKYKVQNV